LLAGSLVLAVVAAHAPALRAGFVFDDVPLVLTSPSVHGPLSSVWLGSDAPDYLPVTWSVFWLEWRLWGASPVGYHAASVLMHACVALLLWRVLKALDVKAAWLGALIFAIHPVAVESVAWISEQKNTVSAIALLGSVLAWLAAERRDRTGPATWNAARTGALLLFAVAVLSKSSVLMAPFVLLGILFTRRGSPRRADILLISPFIAVALAAGVATWVIHRANALGDVPLAARGVAERLGGAAWALVRYAQTAFVPVGVGFVYPEWPAMPSSAAFYVPALIVLASAAMLWWLRDRPWVRAVALALGYQALMLVPVLGIVDMSYLRVGPMANHLQYLALMGPSTLLGVALASLVRRLGSAGGVVAALGVALLATASFQRAREFSDDLTLWTAAVRDAPGNAFAHKQRAAALAEAGRSAESLDEIEAFAQTTRDPAERHRARSVRFGLMGMFQESVAEARSAEAIRVDPQFRKDLARRLVLANLPAPAIELLEPILPGAPDDVETRLWLGLALLQVGRRSDAVAVLGPAALLAPTDERVAQALASARSAASPR
jgi:hypothetical protein